MAAAAAVASRQPPATEIEQVSQGAPNRQQRTTRTNIISTSQPASQPRDQLPPSVKRSYCTYDENN